MKQGIYEEVISRELSEKLNELKSLREYEISEEAEILMSLYSKIYIGSSNLSNPAVTSGLEWNMKVTEKDSFDIIRKFEATFESYWNDGEFIEFDGEDENNKIQLKRALKKDDKYKNDFHFMLDIHT